MTQLATRENLNSNNIPGSNPAPVARIAMTLENIWMLAENVAASKMYKGFDTPAKVFTLMMVCESEALHPMKAMQIYDFIETREGVRPYMKASAIQALFLQRGGKIEMVGSDEHEARAKFSHPTLQPKPIEMAYTMDQAKKAGRAGKAVYQQDGAEMLWWRLVSKVCCKIDPGIRTGIPTQEEAASEAFDPDRRWTSRARSTRRRRRSRPRGRYRRLQAWRRSR